jgi:hypothetical protein
MSQTKDALKIAIEYIEELIGSDRDDNETLKYLKDIFATNN